MAGWVKGDRVREPRPDIDHAQDVDEELAELVDMRADGGDSLRERRVDARRRIERRHDRVISANHRGTRARRGDDGIEPREDVGEPTDQRDASILVAGVEMELAAAGLLGRELDVVAEPAEQADNGLADLGKQRVVVAGDEERDPHCSDPAARGRHASLASSGGERAHDAKIADPPDLTATSSCCHVRRAGA